MNFVEKKNLFFRLVAILLIFCDLGFVGFVSSHVFVVWTENQIISMVAVVFAGLMMLFEVIILFKGWNKENALYKIAFNPNGRLNNVPFVAVLVFSLLGTGLTLLGVLLNVLTHYEPNISISYVILVASVYLLTNCVIYYIYCFMFKIREINLKKFIK